MPVFPVGRGIEWMRGYRASLEIESTPACRDALVITYRIFPAKLLTEASGRIGVRRISETFETIGKTT
jgi:hypothetical protein